MSITSVECSGPSVTSRLNENVHATVSVDAIGIRAVGCMYAEKEGGRVCCNAFDKRPDCIHAHPAQPDESRVKYA